MLPDADIRRRYVDWALRFVQDTHLAPDTHEQQLLRDYLAGKLSLEQAVELSQQHRVAQAAR